MDMHKEDKLSYPQGRGREAELRQGHANSPRLQHRERNSFHSTPATAPSYKAVAYNLSRSSLKKILSFKGSRRPAFLS